MRSLAGLVVVLAAVCGREAAGQGASKVLVVSGAGAEERAAAAVLADALRRSPGLSVFTLDDAGALSAAALARYDALVVDCDGAWWGDGVQRAVEAFVRKGKEIGRASCRERV